MDEDQIVNFETPVCESKRLISMTTKDVATADVVSDLEEAMGKGVTNVVQNVEDRLKTKHQISFSR